MIRVPTADLGAGAAEDWPASAPRYEIKFLGPGPEAPFVAARLGGVCRPDEEFPGNVVHSVYFDTARLRSFQEKSDGEYRKVKLRLRWYAEGYGGARPDDGTWTAWLEVKVREGSRGFKRRKRLHLPGPSPLGGLSPEGLGAVVRAHLGSALRPTCWLAYSRTRLRGPDELTRISVDRDIRVLWTPDWVAARPAGAPLRVFVVEVKGPTPIPHPALSTVIARHARKRAVSKYALCLEHARGGAS